MTSEFDKVPGSDEPRDLTKWIWLGIIAASLALIVLLWAISSSRERFSGRSVARVKHILVEFDKSDPVDRRSALELIRDLRQRILDGADFEKIAEEYSADPHSAARGGDLGYQPKGTYEEAFEEYVWSGAIGELSDVIATSYGYHLIVVVDRQLSKADAYEKKIIEDVVDKNKEPPN